MRKLTTTNARPKLAWPIQSPWSLLGWGAGTPHQSIRHAPTPSGQSNAPLPGGNYTPPAEISSDANENRRLAHFGRCMLDRGNKYVSKDEYIPPPIVQKPTKDKDCKDRFSPHYNPKICEER